MITLSTGMPSTLASYLKLSLAFFGKESPQVRFIMDKIATSPNGAHEEVITEESQMMYLLATLPADSANEMKELLQ